jgi:aldose 1-epimerase
MTAPWAFEPVTVADGEAVLDLRAGDARVVVRPERGGRIGSVTVGGRELLITGHPLGPVYWGSYPMAPWAGRIRHGEFSFAGRQHRLPLAMPPHALHGVVLDRPWRVTGPDAIAIELDGRWPFRGRVTQQFAVTDDGLDVAMTLDADEPMPAVIGWHPWFRRRLRDGGAPVELTLDAAEMLVRDDDGIPTGERVAPPAGPWDDAFTGLRTNPLLEWPGEMRLELSSSCAWWVVYTSPDYAVCVEPQSGPPDAANRDPEVVAPGASLRQTMRWRWTRP